MHIHDDQRLGQDRRMKSVLTFGNALMMWLRPNVCFCCYVKQ